MFINNKMNINNDNILPLDIWNEIMQFLDFESQKMLKSICKYYACNLFLYPKYINNNILIDNFDYYMNDKFVTSTICNNIYNFNFLNSVTQDHIKNFYIKYLNLGQNNKINDLSIFNNLISLIIGKNSSITQKAIEKIIYMN